MSLFSLISGIVRTHSWAAVPGSPFSFVLTFQLWVLSPQCEARLIHQSFHPLSRSWTQIPCTSVMETCFLSPHRCPPPGLQGLPEPVNCQKLGGLTSHCVRLPSRCLLSLCSQGPRLLTWASGAQAQNTAWWLSDAQATMGHRVFIFYSLLDFFMITEVICSV